MSGRTKPEMLESRLHALTKLGGSLLELSSLCEEQSGAVTWSLLQTLVDGRRGFQLVVFDHAELGGQYLIHFNAASLGELAAKVAWLVATPGALERPIAKCEGCRVPLPQVKHEPGREWLCPKCFSALSPEERRRGVVKAAPSKQLKGRH